MNTKEYLTSEQVGQVHDKSLEILQNVGILVRNQKCLEIFSKRGCLIEDNVVKFPPKIVEETISQFTPKFTFFARDPEYDVTIPDDGPLMVTASSAPNIIDPENGEERPAVSKDIANIAHLIQQLEGYDIFSIPVLANDATEDQFSLFRFYPALKNCSKPIRSNTPTILDLKKVLEMAELIAGGAEAYQKRPFITHHYCPIVAPLTMDFESTEAVIYLLEKKLPTYITVVQNAGVTTPLSLLSCLTVGNAEFLAYAVLAQTIHPGAPLIYAVLATVADMRNGDYAPGAVETAMLQVAHSQMARFYNVPSGGYIGLTGSHNNDAQSGYETGISVTHAVDGGIDMMNAGGLLSSLMVFDYAKAVIDNEISLMVKKTKKGFEFGEDKFLIDLIAEGSHGGFFLDKSHTVKNMRDVALLPKIAVRGIKDKWMKKESLTTHDRAFNEAVRLLSRPSKTAFDAKMDQKIRARFKDLIPEDVEPESF